MIAAGVTKPDFAFPAFFRYRAVSGSYVVTNREGDWVLLRPEEFRAFVEGTVEPGSELYGRLAGKNLVRADFDVSAAVERLRARKRFLHHGPNLHIVVVTLRCNETCVYCHASRADMDAVHTDMTPATAEGVVDLVLASTSPFVTIEFQGGEPLVNFPVVQRVIEYALERNRSVGKRLEFTMVTNLALMDEAKLAYLLERRVQLCTSIDGPEHLHDRQRKLVGGSAFRAATGWIRRINEAYAAMGLDPTLYRVEALLTTTRECLGRAREIVDTYVDLGCRALFLRPVDPFGFASRTGPRVEYPREAYLDFYREATDYMIALNRAGTEVLERYAAIFLTRIVAGEEPGYLDIRSPSGAGLGSLAYNYDGGIFAGDEARMLHEMGDDSFRLGEVGRTSYRELMMHPTIRALAIGSNLDARPDCVNCAYNPYCGVCPVHTYKTQGSLAGRMRESTLCMVHKGIQDYLFGKLVEGDPGVLEVLRRWTTVRDREHFVQGG